MKFIDRVGKVADIALAKLALLGARERFEHGGYPALAEMAFEEAGIKPVYLAEQYSEFNDWRERLRTESGLVISNHPGAVDAVAILKVLDRKDVYFIAAEKNVERLRGVIGDEYLLPAAKNVGELRATLRRVEEALRKGGLVFLFPTGGIERLGHPFEFKGGFAHILKTMRPEQMVYTFHVVPEDVHEIFPKTLPGLQMGSAMLVGKLGLQKTRNAWPSVRVDERYTTAEVWQRLLSDQSISKADKNKFLTSHYLDLFKQI